MGGANILEDWEEQHPDSDNDPAEVDESDRQTRSRERGTEGYTRWRTTCNFTCDDAVDLAIHHKLIHRIDRKFLGGGKEEAHLAKYLQRASNKVEKPKALGLGSFPGKSEINAARGQAKFYAENYGYINQNMIVEKQYYYAMKTMIEGCFTTKQFSDAWASLGYSNDPRETTWEEWNKLFTKVEEHIKILASLTVPYGSKMSGNDTYFDFAVKLIKQFEAILPKQGSKFRCSCSIVHDLESDMMNSCVTLTWSANCTKNKYGSQQCFNEIAAEVEKYLEGGDIKKLKPDVLLDIIKRSETRFEDQKIVEGITTLIVTDKTTIPKKKFKCAICSKSQCLITRRAKWIEEGRKKWDKCDQCKCIKHSNFKKPCEEAGEKDEVVRATAIAILGDTEESIIYSSNILTNNTVWVMGNTLTLNTTPDLADWTPLEELQEEVSSEPAVEEETPNSQVITNIMENQKFETWDEEVGIVETENKEMTQSEVWEMFKLACKLASEIKEEQEKAKEDENETKEIKEEFKPKEEDDITETLDAKITSKCKEQLD